MRYPAKHKKTGKARAVCFVCFLLVLATIAGILTGCRGRQKMSDSRAASAMQRYIRQKYGDKPDIVEMGQAWSSGGYLSFSQHTSTWALTADGYYIFYTFSTNNAEARISDTRQSAEITAALWGYFAENNAVGSEFMLLYDLSSVVADTGIYAVPSYTTLYEEKEGILSFLRQENEYKTFWFTLLFRNENDLTHDAFFEAVDEMRRVFPCFINAALLYEWYYDECRMAWDAGDVAGIDSFFTSWFNANSFTFEQARAWSAESYDYSSTRRPVIVENVYDNTTEFAPGVWAANRAVGNGPLTAEDIEMGWVHVNQLPVLTHVGNTSTSGYIYDYAPYALRIQVNIDGADRPEVLLDPALFNIFTEEYEDFCIISWRQGRNDEQPVLVANIPTLEYNTDGMIRITRRTGEFYITLANREIVTFEREEFESFEGQGTPSSDNGDINTAEDGNGEVQASITLPQLSMPSIPDSDTSATVESSTGAVSTQPVFPSTDESRGVPSLVAGQSQSNYTDSIFSEQSSASNENGNISSFQEAGSGVASSHAWIEHSRLLPVG